MPVNIKLVIPIIVVIIVVIALVFILFRPQETQVIETTPTLGTETPTPSPSPTPTPIVRLYEIVPGSPQYSLSDPTDEDRSLYGDVFKVIHADLRVSKNETVVLTITKITIGELNNKSIPIGTIILREGLRVEYIQITIPLTESEYRTLFEGRTTVTLSLYIHINIGDKTEIARIIIRVNVAEQTTPRPRPPIG